MDYHNPEVHKGDRVRFRGGSMEVKIATVTAETDATIQVAGPGYRFWLFRQSDLPYEKL